MSEPLKFDVPNIGEFTARKRTLGLQIKIEQAYRKVLGGAEGDAPDNLRAVAAVASQLEVLLEAMPQGWSVQEAHVNDCYAVYAALRAAEETFLGGAQPAHPA